MLLIKLEFYVFSHLAFFSLFLRVLHLFSDSEAPFFDSFFVLFKRFSTFLSVLLLLLFFVAASAFAAAASADAPEK